MCGASHARGLCRITHPRVSPQPKPRTWLRRTPYTGGRGRLKVGRSGIYARHFLVAGGWLSGINARPTDSTLTAEAV
ncbi:hypothetical protein HMPREF9123_2061 [Neisseria bacilliformis ATCC BAA-1200]|uniref:Uncharacterized protein n=1 Tax=Neisseria bacilliformis ATCC BAA-1200 TaxID=888742 RepID=F2BEA5_9NEIS|nr:hypothetical protein HMPREF9123_2061 [Neisseria bacilliformis ATCC BAA-1200]